MWFLYVVYVGFICCMITCISSFYTVYQNFSSWRIGLASELDRLPGTGSRGLTASSSLHLCQCVFPPPLAHPTPFLSCVFASKPCQTLGSFQVPCLLSVPMPPSLRASDSPRARSGWPPSLGPGPRPIRQLGYRSRPGNLASDTTAGPGTSLLS